MHGLWVELLRFLAMGGYAKYVWPAYGFTFLMLWAMIYFPYRKRKKNFTDHHASDS